MTIAAANICKISPKTNRVLYLPDLSSDHEIQLSQTETLSQQAWRVLTKFNKGRFVIVGNEPLDAVRSVDISQTDADNFHNELAPFVIDSIAQFRERISGDVAFQEIV